MKGFNCSISTFGFGYSLDSALLDEIADIGHGKYSFIPDSGLVGTVFVNSLSNLLSTYANDVTIEFPESLTKKIKLEDGGRVSGLKLQGNTIHLGSVQVGQPKHIAFSLSADATNDDFGQISVGYHAVGANASQNSKAIVSPDASGLKAQCVRVHMVNTLRKIIENKETLTSSNDLVKQLISSQFNPLEGKDAFVEDLQKDLDGQVTEALSKPEWFRKWGRHYLPSLLGAHLHQQCNNFKDPGVQHYGGQLFFSLRDSIDDIFLKLPPPKPTKTNYATGQTYAAPTNMNAYYNAGGG